MHSIVFNVPNRDKVTKPLIHKEPAIIPRINEYVFIDFLIYVVVKVIYDYDKEVIIINLV